MSLPGIIFDPVRRLPIVFGVLVTAVGGLSGHPVKAACSNWQTVAVWGGDQEGHFGFGRSRQAALGNARAACLTAAASNPEKEICRSAAPTKVRYLCADAKCIRVNMEDGLGWRRGQGWSREAFCIDRGFDGVIRDVADDQGGVCFKGACS